MLLVLEYDKPIFAISSVHIDKHIKVTVKPFHFFLCIEGSRQLLGDLCFPFYFYFCSFFFFFTRPRHSFFNFRGPDLLLTDLSPLLYSAYWSITLSCFATTKPVLTRNGFWMYIVEILLASPYSIKVQSSCLNSAETGFAMRNLNVIFNLFAKGFQLWRPLNGKFD